METNIVWKYPKERFKMLRESREYCSQSKYPIRGYNGNYGNFVFTIEELIVNCRIRKEREANGLKYHNYKWLMVAYAEVNLEKDRYHENNGVFYRRYWWLKDYDIDENGKTIGHPSEAVNPLKIKLNDNIK